MAGNTWGGSWGEAPNCSWGDSWGFEGFVAPQPQPTIPPGGGKGVDRDNYLNWWEREWDRIREERRLRKAKRLPKKKREVLEELDEIILELRSRADEMPREQPKLIADYRETERFYQNALNEQLSLKEMRAYLDLALRIRQELDDEEAILLALH